MSTDPLSAVDALIAERHLLKHPFYRAWQAGSLTPAALATYAAQYYQHVRAFPENIRGLLEHCDDPGTRETLEENLRDESEGTENHAALWLRFAAAVGCTELAAESARPEPETETALAIFREAMTGGSFTRGLATLYAYESMVPEVSAQKIQGLAEHYGIEGSPATDYFAVHQSLDVLHAAETRAHLADRIEGAEDEAEARAGAGAALAAVNRLLDGICRLHAIAPVGAPAAAS